MTLVAGPVNKQWLINLTNWHTPDCSEVLAAIAYASVDNLSLFNSCKEHGKSLTYYGRYDERVPVAPEVVKWFLDQANPNFVCRMVPDVLHAKVIWWVDVGAYIGSANLSDRAWNSNIEAGIYLSQDDLEELGMLDELSQFFDVTSTRSQPIGSEFYEHLLELVKQRANLVKAEDDFKKRVKRFFPIGLGLTTTTSASASTKAYDKFEQSWRESLQALRDISNLVALDENRPSWIPANTPTGAQADQFIHAYYYRFIKGHLGSHLVDTAYAKNKNNPQVALRGAIEWWKNADFDYSEEERHLLDWAPSLQAALSKVGIRSMTKEEFIDSLSKVHAIRAYGGKRRNADLGILSERAKLEDKLASHLTEIWEARSKSGKTVVDLFEYVIWGSGSVEQRIWSGVTSDEWRIQNLGFSALGEIVGWARPNEYPPRNDRSIKGLRALGQRVRSV